MSYSLKFKKAALKEWRKLDGNLQTQFKKKLEKRLQDPYVPASRLSGTDNRFKIKLRNAGYRLVYEVRESEIVVIVITVGKREGKAVYKTAVTR
jgi:mRNA interferase RelE/StbE